MRARLGRDDAGLGHGTAMRRCLIALAILQVLDVAATYVIVTHLGGAEVNPFVQGLLVRVGWAGVLLYKLGLAVLAIACLKRSQKLGKLARLMVIGTVTFYAAVVAWATALVLS